MAGKTIVRVSGVTQNFDLGNIVVEVHTGKDVGIVEGS